MDEDEEEAAAAGNAEPSAAAAAAARRRRRRRAQQEEEDLDPDALVEAQEIFGDISDLMAAYEAKKGIGAIGGGSGDEEEECFLEEGGEEEGEGEEDDVYDDEEDDAFLEDDEEGDDGGEHSRRRHRGGRRRASFSKSLRKELRQREAATERLRSQLDHNSLARHYLLPQDERIKQTDIPEREQLHPGGGQPGVGEVWITEELQPCAEWVKECLIGPDRRKTEAVKILDGGMQEVQGIPPPQWYGRPEWQAEDVFQGPSDDYHQMMMMNNGSNYGGENGLPPLDLKDNRALLRERADTQADEWRNNEQAQQALLASILSVLEELHVEHHEVPFIGLHRKEKAGQLLAMRPEDRPGVTSRQDVEMQQQQQSIAGNGGVYFVGAVQPQLRNARRWDVLYAVQSLSLRWKALEKRRGARRHVYVKAHQIADNEEARADIQTCLDQVDVAQSLEELEDAEALFRLVSAPIYAADREHVAGEQVQQGIGGLRIAGNGNGGNNEGGGEEEEVEEGAIVDDDDAPAAPAGEDLFLFGDEEEEAAAAAANGGDDDEEGAGGNRRREARPLYGDDEQEEEEDQQQQQQQQGERRSNFKKAGKLSIYESCRQAGLLKALVPALGMTTHAYADNIFRGYTVTDPINLGKLPLTYASEFIKPDTVLSDPDRVLKALIKMTAAEVAAQPKIRQKVRENYILKAIMETFPTMDGLMRLDAFHPYGAAKNLRSLPVKSLLEGDTDLWLKVLAAEREGLITVVVKLPEDDQKDMMDTLVNLISGSSTTDTDLAWDLFRRQVVNEALEKTIWPTVEKEVKAMMNFAARQAIVDQMSETFWKQHASVRPLELETADDGTLLQEKRVMACCYGQGGDMVTTFAMLDPQGNLVDYLHANQYTGAIPRAKNIKDGRPYTIFEDPKKMSDAEKIKNFIMDHRPHAIVLGVSHSEALVVMADVEEIINKIVTDFPQYGRDMETGYTTLHSLDESLPTIWQNSAAALGEFANNATIVRRAVALGRRALDPLAVVASLCSPATKEILALPLHPLQNEVSEDERIGALERVLVTMVSQVGVDINTAATIGSGWMGATLPFVPGLGHRKAAALMRAVNRAGGFVEDRKSLCSGGGGGGGLLGAKVYANAASALRVKPVHREDSNNNMGEFHPLDNTRIHPECYDLALQMAASAVGEERSADAEVDEVVENAMQLPGEVQRLQLSALDAHLMSERQDREEDDDQQQQITTTATTTKLPTLIDIQFELLQPYGDVRHRKVELQPDEIFYHAAGEGKSTLKPGRRVEASIRYVTKTAVYCNLPDLNNIQAVLEHDPESVDDTRIDFLDAFRRQGGGGITSLPARILHIPTGSEGPRGMVKLTIKREHDDDAHWERVYLYAKNIDHFAVTTREAFERAQRELTGKLKSTRPAFRTRPIRHLLYKNISESEAEAELGKGDVGEALFRPASKDTKTLYLTIHMPGKDCFWHVLVKEGPKPTGQLTLGTPLKISYVPNMDHPVVYEDLDEIEVQFIQPVAQHLKSLAQHRKWKGGRQDDDDNLLMQQPDTSTPTWEEIKLDLQNEKARSHPSKAVYCISFDRGEASPEKRGLYLAYILNTTPRREFFMVVPEGFRFRRNVYASVDGMLMAFQKQPRGAPSTMDGGGGDYYYQQQQSQQQPMYNQQPHLAQYYQQQHQQRQPPPPPPQPYYAAAAGGGYGGGPQYGGR